MHPGRWFLPLLLATSSWLVQAETGEAAPPVPATLDEAHAQRARADALRAEAETRYKAEQNECYRKFLVTDCLVAARKRYTAAIAESRRIDEPARHFEREAKRQEAEAKEAQRLVDHQKREAEQKESAERYRAEQQARAAERERKLADKARQAEEGRQRSAAEQAKRQARLEKRANEQARREAKRAAEGKPVVGESGRPPAGSGN